ncbi:DUF3492 domain-containing protein [Dactylosporangium sp. CA-139114]|uniref:DUF3492 domain-containing protein n=1 Tax=Dactylosporangium sp. CA-139114 TaxID=3239931 RepID=UPI003D97E9B9
MSEGTYPQPLGAVGVWCDQLVRGLPEHRWGALARCVDGREPVRWELPENLERVVNIPLWGAGRTRPNERLAAPALDGRTPAGALR